MATEVLMPSLSPTMEEGILAKWLVNEGDTVTEGQAIAEIETDKATMEHEAPDAGILARIVVQPSEKPIKVGVLLGYVALSARNFWRRSKRGSNSRCCWSCKSRLSRRPKYPFWIYCYGR